MDYKDEKEILWNLVLEYREQIETITDKLEDCYAIIKALKETQADMQIKLNSK